MSQYGIDNAHKEKLYEAILCFAKQKAKLGDDRIPLVVAEVMEIVTDAVRTIIIKGRW
jgi:hypothetical protein